MKPIIIEITIILSTCSAIAFAQPTAGNSTTTTITNTTTSSPNPIIGAPSKTTESTTYTTTTTNTVTSADDDIVTEVYGKYAKESALLGTALNVTAQNGIVTVSGTVIGQAQADAAISAAKTIPGVRAVRSDIHVTTNPVAPQAPIPNY